MDLKTDTTCPCSCKESCNCFTKPVVWTRIGIGYRIETLQKKYFDQAVELIKDYYFQNDKFLDTYSFGEDANSVAEFIKHLYVIMENESSLVLINDMNGDYIVGVLLLSIVNKLDFGRVFSHSNMRQGKANAKCIQMKTTMHKKIDFFLDYQTNTLLRYYLICIADEHRGNRLGFQLFRTGLEVARHLCIPIACGVFTTKKTQTLAKRLGFEIVDSICYDWYADENIPLQDVSFIALMIGKVPNYYVTPIVYAAKKDEKKKAKKKSKKDGKKGKGKKK